MIKIRIVKIPPEAKKLAKKLEDTLASMVADTVKAMVGVDNDLKNLEITVSEELIKDDALTEVAWKEISQKMYDEVLSSQYGVDNKNCFSISPDSIQLKAELQTRVKTEQVVLDDLEAMVDMHTESHRL